MNNGNLLTKFLCLLGCLTATTSMAQDVVSFGDVEAMGRAGSANGTDNTAITMNPATIGLVKRYEIQTNLSVTKGPGIGMAVGVTDSKTSAVSLGLVYQRLRYDGGQDSREWPGWVESDGEFAKRKRYDNVTLAIAYPLLDNRLSFGLNGTLAKFNHDIQGKGLTGNMDFGVAASPTEYWSLGVVGHNVLPVSGCGDTQKQNATCLPDFDTGILIGTYLGTPEFGGFALDVDVHLTGPDDSPPVSIRTGFQKTISTFVVETGYRWEGPTNNHWLTMGFGITKRNTGMVYSLGIPLDPKPWDPLLMTHMISFRVVGIGSGPDSERPPGF